VARHCGAVAACQDCQPVIQSAMHAFDTQRFDPGRGQLDGQRNAVQSAANLANQTDFAAIGADIGRQRVRALNEQVDGGTLQNVFVGGTGFR
jgi:hypothetical protein